MRTSNGLDIVHIRTVGREALLRRPRGVAQAVYCEADGDRVWVRVLKAGSLMPVEVALRRVGYALDDTDVRDDRSGRRLRTQATGWSLDGLQERRASLEAAALVLQTSFGSSMYRALEALREAHKQGDRSDAAPRRARNGVTGPQYVAIRQDAGSLVKVPVPAAGPQVAVLVQENNALCDRLLYLLRCHERLADEAIDRFVKLARSLPADKAGTRALKEMTPRLNEVREESERQTIEPEPSNVGRREPRSAAVHVLATEHAAPPTQPPMEASGDAKRPGDSNPGGRVYPGPPSPADTTARGRRR